jgi:hypothetical protein
VEYTGAAVVCGGAVTRFPEAGTIEIRRRGGGWAPRLASDGRGGKGVTLRSAAA